MTAVLVTRPLAQAKTTASSLQKLGYAPFIEPLLTIVPTDAARPSLQGFQAVMITSRNALSALENRRGDAADLLKLPCFCVGASTGEAARGFGFSEVYSADGDRLQLEKLTKENLPPSSALLHICGQEVAVAAPDGQNPSVIPWPVYEARAVQSFTPDFVDNLSNAKIDAGLFFSPRTAGIFVTLVQESKLQACCNALTAIGMSEAVRAALRPLPWKKTAVAEKPAEEAVLACLQRNCPAS